MLADSCSVCDRLNDYVGGQLFCFAIGLMIMLADNRSVCDRLNDYVGGQLCCLR